MATTKGARAALTLLRPLDVEFRGPKKEEKREIFDFLVIEFISEAKKREGE